MDITKLKTAREEYEGAETDLADAIKEYNKAISEVRREALKVCDQTVAEAKEKERKKVKDVQERLHARQKEYNEIKEQVKEELQKSGLGIQDEDFYRVIHDSGFAKVLMRKVDIPDPRDINNWPNMPLWITPTWFRKQADITISNGTSQKQF